MIGKGKPDLSYSDVTPRGLYMGRRNFLLGLLATTGVVAGWKKFPGLSESRRAKVMALLALRLLS